MFDFNQNINPCGIDLSAYNPDQKAMEHVMEMAARFPSRPAGKYPYNGEYSVHEIIDVPVPSTGYPSSSCRIYYPSAEGPFPVLFFIHGGAFYGGWQFLDEPFCREICSQCGIAVVSPRYVLAPEFPFPLPLIEMYRDLLYLKEHGAEYRLDMSRIAIGGGSAGAAHAMALCQIAAERFNEDALSFRYGVFYYPFLDGTLPPDSRKKTGDQSSLSPQIIAEAIRLYASDSTDLSNPLFSAQYMDLSALPPCMIFSGTGDPLNTDFRNFADRLLTEGNNEVLLKVYPGAPHGFLESDGDVKAAADSKNTVCAVLKNALK